MTTSRIKPVSAGAMLTLLLLLAIAVRAEQTAPLSIAKIGNIYAGGKYTEVKGKKVMSGQVYEEFLIPAKQTSPYPVVMVHGGGVTGSLYMQTPDGREGWAQYFLRTGFAVHVVDQPARGRSAYVPEIYGPMGGAGNPENLQQHLSRTGRHTRWPPP